MFNTSKTDGISTGVVVWQSKNTQVAQGGFTLDDATLPVGSIIPIGTPIGFDESTRLAKVGKMAIAQASATNVAVEYKVLKGHIFTVGMLINSGAGTAQAITEIDTSNANYDLVKVGTTLGVAVTAGDAIFVGDIGATAPKGLLYASVEIGANGLAEVTVVLRGTVYARRIPPVPTAVRAKLPLIIFSESY